MLNIRGKVLFCFDALMLQMISMQNVKIFTILQGPVVISMRFDYSRIAVSILALSFTIVTFFKNHSLIRSVVINRKITWVFDLNQKSNWV